ncbi:MAG: hypothetical protein ACRENS_05605 [Candidatus Eiseniibacteriota bacterium]
MNTQNRNSVARSNQIPLEPQAQSHVHSGARSRVIRGASPLAVLLATLALTAAGCGKHTLDQTTSAADGIQAAVTEQNDGKLVVASLPAPDSARAGEPVNQSGETLSADSLPPDVDAASGDSLVTPGSVVEISALASPDVVDMGLSDGVSREQPFSYDSTMKVWRVFYRVPIKTSKDRIGLAVTATNSGGHWRRVWVFLNLQP